MHASPTMRPQPNESADRLVDDGATSDQRTYALLMHASLAATLLSIPPVIAPLIMWLIKRDESPFLDDHGKEAVNFQLSLVLYSVILGVLGFVTCVGFIFLPVVWVLGIVGAILAATAANRGEYYRYPATIRFIT